MIENIKNNDEKKIELIMSYLLRTGVLLAAAMVIFGAIIYLTQNGFKLPHYSIFKGEPAQLRSLPEIFLGIFSLNSLSIMQFGLLLLIATPVARVIFSVLAFLYEKDFLYVVFTLIVLSILLYSLFT